jgi:hypothetical protein
MTRNLVGYFCQGEGKRFGGIRCDYFIHATSECTLLKEFELYEVFEKGRCEPFEMLKRALEKHLEKYRDIVDPGEHIEPMAFEILERLKSKRLTQGHKIYVLKGYINKAVYCSVIEMLQREEPLVKRQCGSCRYLSQSKPHICQRATIFTSEKGEVANPYYESKRKLTERACKKGFEPVETTSIDASPDIPQSLIASEVDYTGILLADMTRLLAEGVERSEDQKTKRQEERRYIVFCQLIDLLMKGISQKEALKIIAATLDVSVKTINRELLEIRKFFKRESVF